MKWKSQWGFIWAVLGSVVGFANVLSFSAQCYKNGGGAFLIPYFLAYLVLGLPLLILEGTIGQKMKMPLVAAYGQVAPRWGKYLGWIAVLSCLTIGAFYIVLTGYSLLYTYFATFRMIPPDTARFFVETVLHETGNLLDFGMLVPSIFITVLAIAGFVFWTLVRDISEGVEAVCSVMMPMLAILVLFFAVAASFLPGAFVGIQQFLLPDFSRLTHLSLWRDVFGQLFFSLSLGLGIITGYSQYNDEKTDLKKSMLIVAIGDFAISFIAGWGIFACLGYMSLANDTPFRELVTTTSSFQIGFVIFPKIIQTFHPIFQPVLGMFFFFSVFIAGITGVFSITESVVGNIQREFNLSRKKGIALGLGAMLTLSIFFCMGNGQELISALAPMVLGITMIMSGLAEIFVFREFAESRTLRYIVPALLLTTLGCALIAEAQSIDLAFAVRWGWLAVALLAAKLLQPKRALERPLPL